MEEWLANPFLNSITEQTFIVVVLVAKLCPTLETPGTIATILLCPWGFLGKDTRVGCHFLPWEIFLTQGWNLSFLDWHTNSLPLTTWEAQ